MAQGWVIEVFGGEQEARAKWPKGIAIGKLNVVQADGKDPRMVLDSSVCNVNPRCTLPERVCLPTAADVRTTFKPHDPPNASQGAALDFKAAHKRVKVRHSDQGLLLFRNAGRLYAYVVCHFGARFSAYWWQRVGALLLRLLHRLMAPEPHKAWLYVDDLLLSLLHCRAPQQLAFVVAYLSLIGAPISWKKASFGPSIIWCGWQFCFRTETVCLAQPKLDKLRAQLLQLLQHKRVPRKELEACLGLLMWATSISPHLRCFTAPIYSDLHSPPGTCYPVPPRSWSQFLWCLDASCKITKDASSFSSHCMPKLSRSPSGPKRTFGLFRPPTRRSGSALQTPQPRRLRCATKAKPPYTGSPSASPMNLSCRWPASLFCPAYQPQTPWQTVPPSELEDGWPHPLTPGGLHSNGTSRNSAQPGPSSRRMPCFETVAGSAANGLRGHWLLLPQVLRRLAQRQ